MNEADRLQTIETTGVAPLTLTQCAEKIGGRLTTIAGLKRRSEPDALTFKSVRGAAPPAEAIIGDVTMIDQSIKTAGLIECQAIAVITTMAIELAKEEIEAYRGPAHQIIVTNAHAAMTTLVQYFRPALEIAVPPVGIDPSAIIDPTSVVHPTATIGQGTIIGARCRIFPGVTIAGGCVIGDDCILHPSVTLYPYTRIADRVVVHAGTIIGANGFGYRNIGGRHVPTAQLGYVAIESDVEIGAAVTIDRGTYGATRIGEGTKIDNQVMIAHNCQIGKHNLLCSQVGIAGSCTTGDYVVLAGQVGLKDHIHLGDGAIVGAQAGVMEDLEGGRVYLGSPATTQRDQMQIMAVQRRLPDMRRELRRLDRAVADLTEQIQHAETQTTRKAA